MKSVILMCTYSSFFERLCFDCVELMSSTWFVFLLSCVSFWIVRRWINKKDEVMVFLSLLSLAFSAQRLAFFDLSGDVEIELRKQLETSTHAGILSAVGDSMNIMSSGVVSDREREFNLDCLVEG